MDRGFSTKFQSPWARATQNSESERMDRTMQQVRSNRTRLVVAAISTSVALYDKDKQNVTGAVTGIQTLPLAFLGNHGIQSGHSGPSRPTPLCY